MISSDESVVMYTIESGRHSREAASPGESEIQNPSFFSRNLRVRHAAFQINTSDVNQILPMFFTQNVQLI